MSDPALREAIIKEIRARSAIFGYCTWWFKFAIPYETKAVRRELEKMKREGLVTSNHEFSNNTRWALSSTPAQPAHSPETSEK